MRIAVICLSLLVAGCNSISIGTALPIPGPFKPTVGLSFTDKGVKGHGGVGTNVGGVGVGVGGSTEAIPLIDNDEEESAKQQKSK